MRLRCLGHIINIATTHFMFSSNDEAVRVAAERTANTTERLEEALTSMSEAHEGGWRRYIALQKLHDFTLELRYTHYHNTFKRLARKMIKLPRKTR
jgi:hypothetical protein